MNDAKQTWRKSSFSQPNNGNCVEVAHSADAIGVRDSKNPENGRLTVTPAQWAGMLAYTKSAKDHADGRRAQ